MEGEALVRIGELSRRSGVSPELLRAWERRYGLLQPIRSAGGLRLYSVGDLERVRTMRRHLTSGVAAAEAAALALRDPDSAEPAEPALSTSAARAALADALDRFDEPGAQAVLDRLLIAATVDTVLAEVVLPYLNDLGERWARGEASVAQEHFASNVLRGRMLSLARGWGRGLGPLALLACLPDERHDLGLVAFGLALRGRGWRIGYLGADTPFDTLEETADSLAPALVALTAVIPEHLEQAGPRLRSLALRHRVALGGAGVSHAAADWPGVLLLGGDPVAEAERLTRLVGGANGR
jgi:MerR family transcriptional regulator, light-induced transcriptional regulator